MSGTKTVGPRVQKQYQWRNYSESEVAQHNKEDDIWMIIHGKVYDIVSFLEDHPGGPEILHQHAGKDATQDFEETFHSATARQQLKDYVIGGVEGYTGADDAATATKKSSSGATQTNGTKVGSTVNPVLLAVGVALVALIAYTVLF